MADKKLTNDEANAMLAALTKHFGVPVMPVTRYCDALRTWRKCIDEANAEDPSQFKWLSDALIDVDLAIRKSSLLWRLIYNGEKLRTQKCPVHKGHWSGIPFGPEHDCPHGCDLTGWIAVGFEPPKPGDPCRHKWRNHNLGTGKVTCAECGEEIAK